MNKWLEAAKPVRAVMDQAGEMLTDAQASTVPTLYPVLQGAGALIPAGTRINWNGTLKRAAVDLWDREENNPDNAQVLWADLEYRDGYRVILEGMPAEKAFALNEVGWWNGTLYRSLRDGNTFNPSVTPEWWEVVER